VARCVSRLVQTSELALIGGANNTTEPLPHSSRPAQIVRQAGKHRAHRRGRWRQSVVVWSSLAIAASVIAAATWVSGIFSNTSPPARSTEMVQGQVNRYGTITVNPGSRNCEQKVFDNDAGSFVETHRSCTGDGDARSQDAKVPLGTVHTMNAISKSFKNDSGKQ